MPASFEEEALKAQAIAARTYTLYRIRGGGSADHPDADACDDPTCCKAYLSAERAAANTGATWPSTGKKLARAVSETGRGHFVRRRAHPRRVLLVCRWQHAERGRRVDERSAVSPKVDSETEGSYRTTTRSQRSAAEFKSLILAAKPDKPFRQPRGMDPRYRAKRLRLCRLRHGQRHQLPAMTAHDSLRCARRRSPWNTRTMPLPSTSQATATVSA